MTFWWYMDNTGQEKEKQCEFQSKMLIRYSHIKIEKIKTELLLFKIVFIFISNNVPYNCSIYVKSNTKSRSKFKCIFISKNQKQLYCETHLSLYIIIIIIVCVLLVPTSHTKYS